MVVRPSVTASKRARRHGIGVVEWTVMFQYDDIVDEVNFFLMV